MNKTTNYNLPQWVESDRLLMEDFNKMTADIDAALTENKTAIEAVAAAAGNCKVITGTYTGTGTYNKEASAVKLTFAKKPFLLLIAGNDAWACIVNMQRGHSFYGTADSRSIGCYNSGNQYWWLSSGNAQTQMNNNGATYNYWAFTM